MKRYNTTVLTCAAVCLLFFAGCANATTEFREVTGTSRRQQREIYWVFEHIGFYYEDISLSVSNLVDGLAPAFVAFDLNSADNEYLLILDIGSRNPFVSLLYNDGTLIQGWDLNSLLF